MSRERELGKEEGYAQGYAAGYHLGRCEAVVRRQIREEGNLWDKKVLYVMADGEPYASIDEGITDALRGLIRDTRVLRPSDDAAAAAIAERPDLVLVLDPGGRPFPVGQIDRIREVGIQTAVWFPDDPYHSDTTLQLAPHYNYVFTQEMSCVPFYKEVGCSHVYHMPFAVNPSYTYPRRADTSYQYDICFIGSAFWNRVVFFDKIAGYLKDKRVLINGYWWDRLKHYRDLADKIRGYWLTPEETYRYYSGAKIVINLHRSSTDQTHNTNSRGIPALSVNPRLFEISACGTLQLSDVRNELPSYYAPGSDLETFDTPEELVQKIDYYLQHEEERRLIALNGLVRTVRDHTYRKRLHQMLSIIWEGEV